MSDSTRETVNAPDMKAASVRLGIQLKASDEAAYKKWIPDARNSRIEFTATICMFDSVSNVWIPITELPESSSERLKRKITFTLKSSSEKGVCMNFPKGGNQNPDLFFVCPCPNCDASSKPDSNPSLALSDDKTSSKDCPAKILGAEVDNPKHSHHYLQADTKDRVAQASVVVRCEDYGAFGTITAKADGCEQIPPASATMVTVKPRLVKLNVFKVGDSCFFCTHRAHSPDSKVAHEKDDLKELNRVFAGTGIRAQVDKSGNLDGKDYLLPDLTKDEYDAEFDYYVKTLGRSMQVRMEDLEASIKKRSEKRDQRLVFWEGFRTQALVDHSKNWSAADPKSVDVYYVPKFLSGSMLGLALLKGAPRREVNYKGDAPRPIIIISTSERRAESLAHELAHVLSGILIHDPDPMNIMADNPARTGAEMTERQKNAFFKSALVLDEKPSDSEPKANANTLRIPFDDNENDIADEAQQDKFNGVEAMPDEDDDKFEGNDHHGDGFTNYEEYRGFLVLGPETGRMDQRKSIVHVRTDITRKDVFLKLEADSEDKDALLKRNPSILINDYALEMMRGEGIEVHILPGPEYYNDDSAIVNAFAVKGGKQRVNFNECTHTMGAQHGVRVRMCESLGEKLDKDIVASQRGSTITYSPTETSYKASPKKRACPETTNRCIINMKQIRDAIAYYIENSSRYFAGLPKIDRAETEKKDLAAVVVHEIFHALGVVHHSEKKVQDLMDSAKIEIEQDKVVETDLSPFSPRPGERSEKWEAIQMGSKQVDVKDPKTGEVKQESRETRVILNQQSKEDFAKNPMASNPKEKIVVQFSVTLTCELPGGWTSGQSDCIMRYLAPEAVILDRDSFPKLESSYDDAGKKFAFVATGGSSSGGERYNKILIARKPSYWRDRLCTGTKGTGLNSISDGSKEIWCNDAAKGNCRGQVWVRDWDK